MGRAIALRGLPSHESTRADDRQRSSALRGEVSDYFLDTTSKRRHAPLLECNVRSRFEVPVILVFHGCSKKTPVAHAPDEIRGYRQPMRSISDLHGVPGHDLIPLQEHESSGKSASLFFELENFPAGFVDENPPGPRGIVRPAPVQIAEAATRRRTKAVDQCRPATQLLAPGECERGGALRVKQRLQCGAEAGFVGMLMPSTPGLTGFPFLRQC